ncbi:MAG: AraC family transcriptional regulator [Clostridia bacterium]|uniref:AraC family transcriptional regulator n=1 Tax=Pumilibacter muris TaxID=2941510 RepID=UPI00203D5DEC|nr:helix-turn-helix domain-containing protein [Pumilibacter muris]MCI8596242.1 AraC family transcriptional regulator [Clostridia bacterium]
MSGITKKTLLRQRPRLLYAGLHNKGAGWLTDKHEADGVEILFVAAGSGKAEINGSSYPFAAGDFIVCNKGCLHREFFDEALAHELLFAGIGNLRLYGHEPDTVLKEREFCIIHTEEYYEPLRGYMSQLVAETEGTQPLKEAIAEHLLKIILLFTVRLVSFDSDFTFKENASYLAAKEYFDEHFLDIKNMDSVCKSLYVNKYYLTHLFSQNEGISPVQYLINKRIELACKELEATDDNVADIGKRCGYADPCYFSRVFKKVKGVTPLRYRYVFKEKK